MQVNKPNERVCFLAMGYLSCRTEAATGTCETAHQKQKRQRQRPESPQIFSFSELQLATDDFSEDCLLGKGSHGLVYKGVLKNGKEVAVKRATYARQLLQDESSFDNELEILSKIWSDRLVNLLGYTREEDEKLLVVEFMPNGTLHDNLHDSFSPMSWAMRIHLALQIAKGIFVLHSASPPIIHRDIKSSNVLIDENGDAKLGDFGLALRGHIEDMLKTSTPPAGTMGYLDPEYETPSDLSTKTDVFSFGILLLEMISGRNAIDLAYEPPSILDWALPLIKHGKISEVLDKKIPVPRNFKPLKLMINLAIKCVRTSRYKRPSMFDVVEDLKDIDRKVSLSALERVVRKSVNAQRPWPGASARRAKVSSHPHHKRLLSQLSRLAERDAIVLHSGQEGGPGQSCADERSLQQGNSAQSCAEDGDGNNATADGITQDPRLSTPFATDCSEVESEAALEDLQDFKSANASFRSSSASASIDLDEEMCEDDALFSTSSLKPHLAKPRSRVGAIARKSSTTPLSPCISPGVSHELGLSEPCEPCTITEANAMEDYATVEVICDPLCEITQVQDLITSQYDLVEHPVSRSSSRSGSGSVRSNQARLLELQNAQLKAMNEVFRTGVGAGDLDRDVRQSANSIEVCSLPNEDTGAARRTAYVAIKTLATTCLGAALRPCVRLKEEEELTTTTYFVDVQGLLQSQGDAARLQASRGVSADQLIAHFRCSSELNWRVIDKTSLTETVEGKQGRGDCSESKEDMAECRKNRVGWRIQVLSKHLALPALTAESLQASGCLAYAPPETNSDKPAFDKSAMRVLLDGHDLEIRDWAFNLMANSDLFVSKRVGDKVFASPDFNEPTGDLVDKTLERILYLHCKGVFRDFLSESLDHALRRSAVYETIGIFDHSLVTTVAVHYELWGGAILYMGTKRHHDKWLQLTREMKVQGCFAMTELGHGSNVRGLETLTTYNASSQEFIIDTPCESAQKYWIGGAAKHATHSIVFSQLLINGRNEGVHAFVCQIRTKGRLCSGIRIADCGHKTALNGVDNGRIWFDKVRIPRENLLNAVADVTPDGQYVSSIKDPDERFGVFMSSLSGGRVNISVSAINQAKLGLATALRYALTRRVFSPSSYQAEVLLLDYPSHQHRLLPLMAKTYAMNFAALDLKKLYHKRNPQDSKVLHVLSSGFKAVFSWHSMRTLQECREACGGQAFKTENRIGKLEAEYDVQSTFEGDNNVLMQQVSKGLLGHYHAAQRKGKPVKGMRLEHLNGPRPVMPKGLIGHVLRDSTFQLALFQLRERGLLELLDAQVKNLMATGLSSSQALMVSYQLAQDLGRAFSERAVLESILGAEHQATGSITGVLGLLRMLYVLSEVDENPIFLRYGFLSPEQSQLIHPEVAALCAELRPQTLHLVDSFGIPQPFLGPIAYDWVEFNSWDNVNASSHKSIT